MFIIRKNLPYSVSKNDHIDRASCNEYKLENEYYVLVTLCIVCLGTLPSTAVANAAWTGQLFNGSVPAQFNSTNPAQPNTYNMLVNSGTVYQAAGPGSYVTNHNIAPLLPVRTFNYIGNLTAQGGLGLVGISNYPVHVNFDGDVNYSATATTGTPNYPREGMIGSSFASVVRFTQNTTLTSSYNLHDSLNTSGSTYHTGVLAGSSVPKGNDPTNNGQYASVIFNNLSIAVTDSSTGNAVLGLLNPVSTWGFRAIQGAHNSNYGQGSAGYIEVQGDLEMHINADRALGIYVSGNPFSTGDPTLAGLNGTLTPKVVLNNSTVVLKSSVGSASALTHWDSHGIKLGKVRTAGEGSGLLDSKGHLVIDTTAALHGGGIKMLRNSQLMANFSNSSTQITTNGYALEIGGFDDLKELSASHGVVARFKNAQFTTNGTSADPQASGAQARQDLIFVDQGQVGTVIGFSGDQTNLTAHTDGYILNVSGNYTVPGYTFYANKYAPDGTELGYNDFEGSSVTFEATDAGNMTGLVTKGTVKTAQSQTLDSSKIPSLNLRLSNGFTWKLHTKGSDNIANFDALTLESGATLHAAINSLQANDFILHGNVRSDAGVISLSNLGPLRYDDTLTIDGNYEGSAGAAIRMNTLWNGDNNSLSDIVRITGSASGSTQVTPIGANGQAQIIDGNVQQVQSVISTLPVIIVDTSSASSAFTGVTKTTSIAEVQLAKRTNSNGQDEYYWTAKAQDNSDIYTPSTGGYSLMPRVNLEQGYSTLATLHQRRGDNQALSWLQCENCTAQASKHAWGRMYGMHLQQDSTKRLNFDSDIYGLQMGYDFQAKDYADASHRLTGAYIAYSHAQSNFEDRYRAHNGLISADKYTGKGTSDALSLGITSTRYNTDGAYTDVVGQLSYLHNKYDARDGASASQNGWGVALSAEVGKPYPLNTQAPQTQTWFIEPQAQLIYQYLSLNRVHDGIRQVEQADQHGLRGRIGARIFRNQEHQQSERVAFYGVANLWHELLSPNRVRIGASHLREKYAKSWLDVGLGLQRNLSKYSYVYADARYEYQLSNTQRQGYRATIGFKHTWY